MAAWRIGEGQLVFYSIGVWSERIAGRLRAWHLVFVWLGLVCDTVGAAPMLELAGGQPADGHGITGVTAIRPMIVRAVWATAVLIRVDEVAIRNFHPFDKTPAPC